MSLIQRTTSALLVAGRIVTLQIKLWTAQQSLTPVMSVETRKVYGGPYQSDDGQKGHSTDHNAISEICAIVIAWPSKFSTGEKASSKDAALVIGHPEPSKLRTSEKASSKHAALVGGYQMHAATDFETTDQPFSLTDHPSANVRRLPVQIQHWSEGIQMHTATYFNAIDQLFSLRPPVGKFCRENVRRLPANIQIWLGGIQMHAATYFDTADYPF
ncbi:hypothetical protein B0H10DRAFT_1974660 [Mycena sp. CBHHK59/15]|nr:hypothetical protein B0H10DRAFT_1974660 [Mycena sp. CBHHK59/15]